MQVDITQLLVRWSAGDDAGLQELTTAIYGALRRLGHSALRREIQPASGEPAAKQGARA